MTDSYYELIDANSDATDALGISLRSAYRCWALARAWLARELQA